MVITINYGQAYKLSTSIQKEITVGHDLYALSMAKYLIPKIMSNLSIKSTLIAWKHILSKTKKLHFIHKSTITLKNHRLL